MSDAPSRLAEALADRYRIERALGAGGMATVYLAQDLKHDRKVAIKVLKPELAAVLGAERFVVEIKTTAALSHPHILPLFDSGEADSFLYYVMPYIEGETIRDHLNREGQFGIDEAVRIASAVADALDYAHRRGVIHRDIKPENLLLHDGRPMVMDFGIALAVSAAAGGRMTETGLSLGTPHYMSPEQATADKSITGRSDVYSLASVLYEMLTGEPPHMGTSAQQIIMKIIAEPVKPATELRKAVPPHVEAALAKALEKLPADRFATAKDFAEALTNPAYTTGTTTLGSPAAQRQSARLRSITAGLAASTLLLAGLFAWALTRSAPTPVSRYRVVFPDSQALMLGNLAWAPDGSWMVYSGPPTTVGPPQLWVKARNRVDAVPINGARGFGPRVSPDGRLVAFANGNRISALPVGGGPARVIADSSWENASGVWLADGSFAYMDIYAELRHVPADYGPGELLHKPGPGLAAIPIAGLPSTRGILFRLCNAACDPTSNLWVFDLRSREARQLVADVSWAAYRDGVLLFASRSGDVFGVPFDLKTLELQGSPVPLLSGIRVRVNANMALSEQGSLAYVAGDAQSLGPREAVWISRDGKVTPIDSTWRFRSGNPFGLALSPNGSRLAIGILTDGNHDVWIKDLSRQGLPSRLTLAPDYDGRPRWAPDGRTVLFLSTRDSIRSVFERPGDGTGSDVLRLRAPRGIWDVQQSRDGRWLVMRVGVGDGNTDIVGLRVGQDSQPRVLLGQPYDEQSPALSPDGRWLAYVSDETGRWEVFVRPFPEVDTGKWQVSTFGGTSPVWARSGRELFFVNDSLQLVSQEVRSGPSFALGEQRSLVRLAAARVITENNYPYFDVSPDDSRFVFIRRASDDGAPAEQLPLIVVENWMTEVKRLMKGGAP